MDEMKATILHTICRGLVSYVSYLATTSSSPIYSEYILYEPILRILIAKGYSVDCEVSLPRNQPQRGDYKRIDFVAENSQGRMAVEVKWTKDVSINVENDINKLVAYHRQYSCHTYLLVFGYHDHLKDLKLAPSGQTKGMGKIVHAPLGHTHYACRWYRVTRPSS